jgi:hypothetical protein
MFVGLFPILLARFKTHRDESDIGIYEELVYYILRFQA